MPCPQGEGCDGDEGCGSLLACTFSIQAWEDGMDRKAGHAPKIISPGPCLLPARTRFGGLSTIDMNSGLSAG